jgi:hypothetical protein
MFEAYCRGVRRQKPTGAGRIWNRNGTRERQLRAIASPSFCGPGHVLMVGEDGEGDDVCVYRRSGKQTSGGRQWRDTATREFKRRRVEGVISGSNVAGGQATIAGAAKKQVQWERRGRGKGGGCRCRNDSSQSTWGDPTLRPSRRLPLSRARFMRNACCFATALPSDSHFSCCSSGESSEAILFLWISPRPYAPASLSRSSAFRLGLVTWAPPQTTLAKSLVYDWQVALSWCLHPLPPLVTQHLGTKSKLPMPRSWAGAGLMTGLVEKRCGLWWLIGD